MNDDVDLERDQVSQHVREALERVKATTPKADPLVRLQAPDRSAQRVEAHRQLVMEQWAACIPPKLAVARLEHLEGMAGEHDVRNWTSAGDPPPWREGVNLILLGATGVGKSYTAVAAARPIVEQAHACIYWSTPDLFAALDWRDDQHRAVMARAQRCALLVLDDLGAEDPNDWTRRKLYELVNYRWNANLATIVTTNLEPRDLEDACGPRTYSRLAGGAVAVRLVGPDRRRTHAT